MLTQSPNRRQIVATLHSPTKSSHTQSHSPRPGVSRLDWNAPKRTARTSRKEWAPVVRRLMLPICADSTGDFDTTTRPEVIQ